MVSCRMRFGIDAAKIMHFVEICKFCEIKMNNLSFTRLELQSDGRAGRAAFKL